MKNRLIVIGLLGLSTLTMVAQPVDVTGPDGKLKLTVSCENGEAR